MVRLTFSFLGALWVATGSLVACAVTAPTPSPPRRPVPVTVFFKPQAIKPTLAPIVPTALPPATATPAPSVAATLEPLPAIPVPTLVIIDLIPSVSNSANASTNTAESDTKAQLLALHNATRSALGLSHYARSPLLEQAAQAQASYLATKPQPELFSIGVGGHIGVDGSKPAQRVAATGYAIGVADENWAYYRTPQEAFNFWVTDQWHRPQVVSNRYTEVGFGVAPHPAGGIIFIAVYATPR